ncbi:MAG: DNA cytosine methyltransferase [Phycisphaerales bacterium]
MSDGRPLAIDLFCGLGGWSDGLLAEGYDVVGFDVERHAYGDHAYPAQLVLQDVRTLHGSQFRDAALIVASPPCQAYSYMAMPWTRGKARAAAIRADETGAALAALNELFDACFRIQREASAAAGRHIPLVVENVRGAQPWVGRARWNYGSYYLWGDVPALMPIVQRQAMKGCVGTINGSGKPREQSSWDRGGGRAFPNEAADRRAEGQKQPGIGDPRSNGKGDAWFQDGAGATRQQAQQAQGGIRADREDSVRVGAPRRQRVPAP